tara:strand:- start:879 stop:1526 length:648 start_codon:yes stop_codon:yes gene_type:complete
MRKKKPEMSKNKRNISIILCALILFSCSTTNNQNESLIDGFTEEVIDQGQSHYRVVYEGANWINKSDAEAQKVIDYSLLRSAELSLENDFKFFVILSNDSETREIIKDEPSCDQKIQDEINKKRCVRYKSIGDLTSVFLEYPLEVESGTNIISNGTYVGKALFSSIDVYRVIARRYNMDRSGFRFQEQRSVPDHMSALDPSRQSHVRDIPATINN